MLLMASYATPRRGQANATYSAADGAGGVTNKKQLFHNASLVSSHTEVFDQKCDQQLVNLCSFCSINGAPVLVVSLGPQIGFRLNLQIVKVPHVQKIKN